MAKINWGNAVLSGVQYFFGAHSLISGSNYFLKFAPEPTPDHPLAGPFMVAMTNMGLFDLVKIVETAVGICLLLNVWVGLAAMAEMPVSIVIWYMSAIVVRTPRTIYTGWREVILDGILVASYGGYLLPFLRPGLRRWPIWDAVRGVSPGTGEQS